MKGKRYSTEDKIRVLREADQGKGLLEVFREYNLSEVSFYRRKRQFGQIDLNEARKLKELERENGELKKMLAEALLKNRVLEAVARNGEPGASTSGGPRGCSAWAVFRAAGPRHLLLPWASTVSQTNTTGQVAAGVERGTSSLRLPAHRCPFTLGGIVGRQTSPPAATAGRPRC